MILGSLHTYTHIFHIIDPYTLARCLTEFPLQFIYMSRYS